MSHIYNPNSQAPTPGPSATLPDDGDALVVASVNQALQSLLDNTAFLLLLTGSVVNVKNYGAVGDGVADDTAAINAALATLISTGGICYLAPGTYKTTDAINLRGGMSLFAAPGSVVIDQSVGGNDLIGYLGGVDAASPECTIFGITFENSGSGALVNANGHSVRVAFVNCVSLIGSAAISSGGASRFRFRDCLFNGFNTDPCLSAQSGQRVDAHGCRFVFQAAAASTTGVDYENGSSGSVVGCVFDFSPVTSGHPLGVLLNSGVVVEGNSFIQSTSGQSCYCVSWLHAAVNLCVGPNDYGGLPQPFGLPPGPPTAGASSGATTNLVLPAYEHQEFGDSGPASSSPGFASYRFIGSGIQPDGASAIKLPRPMYPGQEITVVLRNVSGSPWFNPKFNTGGTPYGPGVISGSGTTDVQVTTWIANDLVTPGTFIWSLSSVITLSSSNF
jgi:hypothetical protein